MNWFMLKREHTIVLHDKEKMNKNKKRLEFEFSIFLFVNLSLFLSVFIYLREVIATLKYETLIHNGFPLHGTYKMSFCECNIFQWKFQVITIQTSLLILHKNKK